VGDTAAKAQTIDGGQRQSVVFQQHRDHTEYMEQLVTAQLYINHTIECKWAANSIGAMANITGADPGGRGTRAPLFLAKSVLFSILYTMSEKYF